MIVVCFLARSALPCGGFPSPTSNVYGDVPLELCIGLRVRQQAGVRSVLTRLHVGQLERTGRGGRKGLAFKPPGGRGGRLPFSLAGQRETLSRNKGRFCWTDLQNRIIRPI